MLVRLFGKNFGVFRDGFDLSMEAVNLPSDEGRGYFEVEVEGEEKPLRLLRLAAIYGPNASGKSTVIEAAGVLFRLALMSGPYGQEGEPIPGFKPFRLDQESRDSACLLGCEVVVKDADGINRIVAYSIEFDQSRILSERATMDGGRVVLLERDERGSIYLDVGRLGHAVNVEVLSSVTRENAAVLSLAAQFKQEGLLPLFRAVDSSLRNIDDLSVPIRRGRYNTLGYSLQRLHQDEEFRAWAIEKLLKPADLGIDGVRTHLQDVASPQPPKSRQGKLSLNESQPLRPMQRIQASFSHRGVDGSYDLDLFDESTGTLNESTGTMKMLHLAGPWYDVIHHQLSVFVDELTASLHPTLVGVLLEAFNAGPNDAPPSQLIFTTHEPTLLEDVLRRDQVYFTEKSDAGVGQLFALAEFSGTPRQNANIRKQYLEGRFGGLPRYPDFRSLFDTNAAETE